MNEKKRIRPSKKDPKKGFTHRRKFGAGFGGIGLPALSICGEKGKVFTTNPKQVDCPKCIEIIREQRAAAKERAALPL
jgi:hypothetical protein